jgi:hypothetical protein
MGLHRRQLVGLRSFLNWWTNSLMNSCCNRNNNSDFDASPGKLPALGGSRSFLYGGIIFVKQRLSRVVSKILCKFFRRAGKKGAFPLQEGCPMKPQRRARCHEDRDPCTRSRQPCPVELPSHASMAHGVSLPKNAGQYVILVLGQSIRFMITLAELFQTARNPERNQRVPITVSASAPHFCLII